MLGVALAFGVHLLNGAALSEFARAARGVNGQPDLVLRARTGALADADLAELLNRPEVAAANPVLEAVALWPGQSGPGGQALSIRLIGLDTLALLASAQQGQPLAPELMPQVDGSSRTRLGTGTAHLSDLTRAYRVNLGLLALMALFTGSFLVYAVLSLATAQRLPQWALVGVLGVSARMRWRLILAEGLVIGIAGTALGLALGVGL